MSNVPAVSTPAPVAVSTPAPVKVAKVAKTVKVAAPAPAPVKVAKPRNAARKAASLALGNPTPNTKIVVLHKGTSTPVSGSRAARWPLLAKAKTVGELSAALVKGGHKHTARQTLQWAVAANLVKLG